MTCIINYTWLLDICNGTHSFKYYFHFYIHTFLCKDKIDYSIVILFIYDMCENVHSFNYYFLTIISDFSIFFKK